MNDTIAAIATAPGEGGISVIRISGKRALPALEQSLRSPQGSPLSFPPRTMILGNYVIPEKGAIDQVLGVYFPGPKSYTGEDVAEIHSHGGIAVAQTILEHTLSTNSRMAEPGEFTKRAFLNGKISLPQAEAIMGLIASQTATSMLCASRGFQGETERIFTSFLDSTLSILSEIQVVLDFPEEEYNLQSQQTFLQTLGELRKNLRAFREKLFSGLLLHQGIHVVLAGRPNVGKSSLFNALLGKERALVTPIPGTTRDIITESFIHKGITFFLHDVAGLRDTEDTVEKLGVHLAHTKIHTSHVVLVLFDGSLDTNEESYLLNLISNLSGTLCIPVISKSDLMDPTKEIPLPYAETSLWATPPVFVSSLNKKGIEEIKEAIFRSVMGKHLISQAVYGTSRQVEEVENALKSLEEAEKTLKNSPHLLDVVSSLLSTTLSSFQKILGKEQDDLLLDKIFSSFCVGK